MKFADAKPGDILKCRGLVGYVYFIKCRDVNGKKNVVSADKDFLLGFVGDDTEVEKVGTLLECLVVPSSFEMKPTEKLKKHCSDALKAVYEVDL